MSNTPEEWPTPNRWRSEHALRVWRAAETVILHSPAIAERRADYELAIHTALQHLQSLASLEALLNHYFWDRQRPFERDDPDAGTVET